MIIVKKIEVKEQYIQGNTLPGYNKLIGDPLEVLMAKYINTNNLTKKDIISINIVDFSYGYITHVNKK